MGVLRPDSALSPRQRRLNKIVQLISVLVGIAFGVEWAKECAAILSAYLADFDRLDDANAALVEY
jgi:hypothetical protein